jgi:signal transduction histidine kinase
VNLAGDVAGPAPRAVPWAVAVAVLRAPVAARTWREFGYVLASGVLAVPAFVLPLLALAAGALSLVTLGLPVLCLVLFAARGTIRYFRWPARALLGWDWPSPAPLRRRGPVAWCRAVLGDGRAWRALAYCLVKFPLAAATAYFMVLAAAGGLFCLTCPIWWFVSPTGFGLLDVGGYRDAWLVATGGAIVLLVFPWLQRFLVWLDRLLVTALLAPSKAERRIARLESSRAALTADAATTLRRVERELHDGTQARLVSLGITLSRIEERVGRLPGDTAQLDTLLGSARHTVTDALAELRDIVRRIHPPALDDGLATALTTLAARSGLPVEVNIELLEPPSEPIATTVYFTAAELLTNAARHAGAARVRLGLTEDDEWLRLVVTDDGPGGAAPNAGGTGLAGLASRARALDGRFDVVSPTGGPTTVTMTLPRG